MSQNKKKLQETTRHGVLDLISGHTETVAAQRLTKGVHTLCGLWMLAKMSKTLQNV